MHWSKFLSSLVNKLLFKKEEVLETSLTPDEVVTLITAVTHTIQNLNKSTDLQHVSGIKPKFVGLTKLNFFCISKKVSHPQSFLPRVTGRLKRVHLKTVVSLTYQLFPLTRFFFFGFVLLCMLMSLIIYYRSFNLFSSLIPCIAILVSYFIALANFKLHCNDIKKVIKEELYI